MQKSTNNSPVEFKRRKLLGEDLVSCSVEELNELELQLETSLNSIKQTRVNMSSSHFICFG